MRIKVNLYTDLKLSRKLYMPQRNVYIVKIKESRL